MIARADDLQAIIQFGARGLFKKPTSAPAAEGAAPADGSIGADVRPPHHP